MNRIAKRLDHRLDDIALFHDLTEAESKEFDLLDGEMDALESNMTLSGTTERYIDRRETEFGVVSDASKPLAQRRSVLVAKLRGQGTTTKAFVKNVARSFSYGEIDVIENVRPYVMQIIFSDVLGVPPNMEDFMAAIEGVMPAHIALEFVYTYNTWDMLEAFEKTWDEWESAGVTFDEMMTYRE